MKLLWGTLMQSEFSGYGRVGVTMATSMKKYVDDAELVGRFEMEWDWRIVVAVPYNWIVGCHYAPDLIWHTMVECRPLAPGLKEMYRLARYVWVPSQFVKEVAVEGGVPEHSILVSGYGVDTKQCPWIDRKDPGLFPHGRPFRYFVWTDGLPTRKGAVQAMKAFDKLDLPDCEMVVKTSQEAMQYKVSNPNIRFIQGNLGWWELAQLMGQCDVMVYPSQGEGFGLMPLEAMSTGMCVIAPQSSGMAEFVRPEYNLVIPVIGTERVATSSASYQTDQFGDKLDQDAIIGHMEWAYNNRDAAYEIGKHASRYVRRRWTWALAAHRAADLLRPLGNWRDGHSGAGGL